MTPIGSTSSNIRRAIEFMVEPYEASRTVTMRCGSNAMKQKSSTRLVLICGLPASGKTRLARELAPKVHAIRLDKDHWTTQLGLDVWDDEFRVRLEQQLW